VTEEQKQISSEWIGSLDDQYVKRFVDSYLTNKTWRENDDQTSHMAHFVQIAYDMPGVVAIDPTPPDKDLQPKARPWLQFVRAAAIYLHAINPSFSKGEWAQLFYAVLRAINGCTYVRIRKRPKLAKLHDAYFLTVPHLMEKYGISRRHAFNLRREAHEIRINAARKK
jgi:hypothetical protein